MSRAVEALEELGEPKWQTLLRIEPGYKRIQSLMDTHDPRLLSTLTHMLESHEPTNKRQIATEILASFMPDDAIDLLIKALEDAVSQIRFSALKGLERVIKQNPDNKKYPCIMEALIKLLRDGDLCIRWEAFETLVLMKDPSIVETLIRLLDEGDKDMKEKAFDRLTVTEDPRVAEAFINLAKGSDWYWGKKALNELGRMVDPRLVEVLIEMLEDSERPARAEVAQNLGKLNDYRAVVPLIHTLQDGDNVVRSAAADALGQLKDPRAMEPLITALKDFDKTVRIEAVKALTKIKDPRIVEVLERALEDSDYDLKAEVISGLVAIKDPRLVEILINALPDKDLQWKIVDELGKLNDARAIEPLAQLLEKSDAEDNDPNETKGFSIHKCNIVKALAKIQHPRVVDALIHALKSPRLAVAYEAADALLKIGTRVRQPRWLKPWSILTCMLTAAGFQ